MTSIENSKSIVSLQAVRIFFEINHYYNQNLRDVFVSAISNPIDFFFKQNELFYVLDGINFEVKSGMRFGFLGFNGCGKTTLCRCIAGMIRPQMGKVETHGEVRAIFDVGNGIMPELTGRENAYLLARLFFPALKDLTPLVVEALEFSELGHFVDIPFKQYSKGMQSRLILSLISAKTTDLLILDEVFDGADIFFQKKIAARMRKLIETAGATIFVSHSIDQIREVCNRVIVLDKGQIQYFGEVETGIETYLNIHQMT